MDETEDEDDVGCDCEDRFFDAEARLRRAERRAGVEVFRTFEIIVIYCLLK